MKLKILRTIKKLRCFIRGHDLTDEGRFDNGCSVWGSKVCTCCGYNHNWQYDYTEHSHGVHEIRPY